MADKWRVLALFFIIGISVFYNALAGDFVHDDLLILSHSFFSQPGKVFGFFSQPYFEDFLQTGLYRPLTQISFAFNFLLSPFPFGFHLVNVLLHIVNSFLVYLFLKKLTANSRISLISSLIFLILPIHVEAVTSIVGRAELLSFFFGILTFLLWVNDKYFLSAITLFLALLAKESAIAVIAIVFLFGWRHRKNWRWLIYYSGVASLYFLFRVIVLGRYAFQTKAEFVFNPLVYSSFYERIFTALKVLVLYLQKIFIPYGLSADYSYEQIPVAINLFSSSLSLAGLGVLGLMFWAVYQILRNKRNSILIWALIFFLLPYLVVSNLILPIGTIMGNRLMYFPSLGAVMILALFIERLLRFSKKTGLAALSVLLITYGLLTISQNRVWASREALLTDNFKKSPNSVVAKTEFGILMLERDNDLAKRLSLEVYDKYPDYIQNLNLRAAVEVQEGNFREAEKLLERALELRPKHQNTLHNLSRVYFTLGKYQEAEKTLGTLVSEYDGKGNVIFYALVQAENRHFRESRRTLESFFGPEIEDESALKVLRGEFEELEDFYIFHKPK